MKCTWKDCNNDATNPQLDKYKNEWANLCNKHHEELEEAILGESFNPKIALKSWILASGGAKKLSQGIMDEQ